jgi:DNA-binding transcriptional LysR family regulator
MELKQLRYFIVLSEELHFIRAAKLLHLSQPPPTRAMRHLDQDLGVEIVVRTSSQAA